jgi:hypothetical protein
VGEKVKTIILKNKGRRSLAITEDGRYIKVKTRKEFFPGYEFELSGEERSRPKIFAPVFAAAMTLLFAFGLYTYLSPAAYVTLDINPSAELTVNRYDFVIRSKAFNKEGEELLDGAGILNRRLKTALNTLVDNAEGEEYIVEGSGDQILLSVFSTNESLAEKFADEIEAIAAEIEENNKGIGVIIASSNVERRNEAEGLGISPGKLLLIQKLQEEQDTLFDPSNYANMSVKDIQALIKQAAEAGETQAGNDKENNGKGDSGLSNLLDKLDTIPETETELHAFIDSARTALEGEDPDIKGLKDQAMEYFSEYKEDYSYLWEDEEETEIEQESEDGSRGLNELLDKLDMIPETETELHSFIDSARTALEGEDPDYKGLREKAMEYFKEYKSAYKDLWDDE